MIEALMTTVIIAAIVGLSVLCVWFIGGMK